MKYEVNFDCAHCGKPVTKTTNTSGSSNVRVICPFCKKRSLVHSVNNQLKKVSK